MIDIIIEATTRVLKKRGYSGTNTNLIAEVAGVSVGSIYQYFPNKESIIATLYQRHVLQMREIMIHALSSSEKMTLYGAMKALVNAHIEAHMVEPELHNVLEIQIPFLRFQKDNATAEDDFYNRIQTLLEKHRHEIRRSNLELAIYIVIRMINSLIHQAILEPPRHSTLYEIEDAIVDATFGYLTIPVRRKWKA
jgi:AcrR family transcriptional regulator